MVSVCLPSDALFQHLPSYLSFSYLGHRVSLQGCPSKVQPLQLTLDEGDLLTAALPDLSHGIAPLGPPAPAQPWLLGQGLVLPATSCGLGLRDVGYLLSSPPLTSDRGVDPLGHSCATLGCCPWPRTWGNSSLPQPFGHGVFPVCPRPRTWGGSFWPLLECRWQMPALSALDSQQNTLLYASKFLTD